MANLFYRTWFKLEYTKWKQNALQTKELKFSFYENVSFQFVNDGKRICLELYN